MRIVITGGTGFIGRALCMALAQAGHHVTVLTRRTNEIPRLFGTTVLAVEWNGRETDTWTRSLAGAEAVINLAGAPISDARWTDARKRVLMESRILSTRLLVEAMSRQSPIPRILISGSGVGYYGASDDHVLDETAANGKGFLADLSFAWEAEALLASQFGTRVIALRTGMVLERDGGALPQMMLPFRLFAGGPILPGTQWVSWIHRRDLVRLILWALENRTVSGPLNAVAPTPVTMTDFCRALGRVLDRPSWCPIPAFAIKLALGELGSLMTTGQRVKPAKALTGGFTVLYPELHSALRAIFREPMLATAPT